MCKGILSLYINKCAISSKKVPIAKAPIKLNESSLIVSPKADIYVDTLCAGPECTLPKSLPVVINLLASKQ